MKFRVNSFSVGTLPVHYILTVSRSNPDNQQQQIKPYRPTSTALSGGIAGAIAKSCTAPLERAQILCQTGASKEGLISTFVTVLRREGVIGLWRGNLANVARTVPHKSILFTANEFFKQLLGHTNGSHWNFIMGTAAGGTATLLTYPLDLIRARLAGTMANGSKDTITSTFRDVISRYGLRGLYKGAAVTMIGAMPYEGVRFGVYGTIRSKLPRDKDGATSPFWKLMTGAFAGGMAAVSTYPNDTIRRMLQVQGAKGLPVYGKGWVGVYVMIRDTYRRKGIRRFYRGVTAKVVRVIPDAAILFYVFETIHTLFEGDDHPK